MLHYNPSDFIFQHLPVKEEVKMIEINRMRNGYIIDTLTSIDIEEFVKVGAKVLKIYEGVTYKESFKTSPFGKTIDILGILKIYIKTKVMISCRGLLNY